MILLSLYSSLFEPEIGTVSSPTQLVVFKTQESFASITWPILLERKSFSYIILSSNIHAVHPIFFRHFKNSFSDRI